MTITAFPINAASGVPSYTSQAFRQGLAALLSPGATGLTVQPGSRPGAGLDTSVSGSTISVSPGVAIVQGGSSNTQGPYFVYSDAVVTKTLTAANATNPRVDLIYARIRDTDADASGARDGDILYLAGTAAASPVAPTPTDTSYVILGTISVPKSGGGSPVVSMATRPYTAAAGGLTVGKVPPPNPYTGQLWDSGDGTQRWDGTRWRYLSYLPVQTLQQGNPPFNQTATYVDFTSAQWAAATVTVPPSGMVRVIIGADISNGNTPTSTCWAAWRGSGASTITAGPSSGLVIAGSTSIRMGATRSRLLTGLPVGQQLTITPQWNISSGTAATATIQGGTLEVQPIA